MARGREGRATARRCGALTCLLLLLTVSMAAGTEIAVDSDPPGQKFWLLPPGEYIALQDATTTDPSAPSTEPTEPVLPSTKPERGPNWLLTSLVSGGALAGGAINAFTDKGHQSFHVADEGWFGADTRYGGADKASHFVDYYIVSKELAKLFVVPRSQPGARTLAGRGRVHAHRTRQRDRRWHEPLGVLDRGPGDGLRRRARRRTDRRGGGEDLVGFRRGTASFDNCCGYSNEIYTADFHLAGAARRLGLNIGPLKYLLLSLTYGTRGYPGRGFGNPAPGRTRSRPRLQADTGRSQRPPQHLVGLRPPRRVRQRPDALHRGGIPLRLESRALVRAERGQLAGLQPNNRRNEGWDSNRRTDALASRP